MAAIFGSCNLDPPETVNQHPIRYMTKLNRTEEQQALFKKYWRGEKKK
jgi:hypothetical protein